MNFNELLGYPQPPKAQSDLERFSNGAVKPASFSTKALQLHEAAVERAWRTGSRFIYAQTGGLLAPVKEEMKLEKCQAPTEARGTAFECLVCAGGEVDKTKGGPCICAVCALRCHSDPKRHRLQEIGHIKFDCDCYNAAYLHQSATCCAN